MPSGSTGLGPMRGTRTLAATADADEDATIMGRKAKPVRPAKQQSD
ncbi:hypothetical protein OHA03_43745 [Streptomyces sp. NBC_00154]|nr:hypothetical protein [Streptomyces sp. NBC_00154]